MKQRWNCSASRTQDEGLLQRLIGVLTGCQGWVEIAKFGAKRGSISCAGSAP
jgi:hypothetical protein